MKVKVKFFASLREITGKREEEIEVPENTTVEGLIEILSSRYGKEFSDYVYDERVGKPRDYLQFLIDGRSASTLQGLKTRLRDGCNFAIIPPVGGG
ncbi:MAG: ubiquitin-like small modifier protein 1 [Candidatus Bathyarchaeia archaeon]|nr:MoaD family protein [Candidatus Bathyarchaeota archaeon]